MMDSSIFGLRFKANDAIHPSPDELQGFLESPKKEGGRERHKDDLAHYGQHLGRIEEFERMQKLGAAQYDFREKMLLGVFSHSHFFKPSLKSAVEQYKYHDHRLSLIDFKKPQDFIRSAQEELARLSPKKKDDQPKIARFQSMIDQRTREIEALKARWPALGTELRNIAAYIQENLMKIQKLCEATITLLVGLQIAGDKQSQLIEDIKVHFKEQVRDNLQVGPVTKQYVENLKEDVAKLSKHLSQIVLEDIYALTRVYEDIHDHAKKFAGQLEELVRQADKNKQRKDIDEDKKLFGRVEQTLVSLLSDYRLDSAKPAALGAETEYDRILSAKRKEMLDHVFALLQKD